MILGVGSFSSASTGVDSLEKHSPPRTLSYCHECKKIGNESSEEDDSVWSFTEAGIPDTLSMGRQKERVSEACLEDVVELPSPKLASLHIDSKAEGSASDEKLGGSKENETRSLEDVQSSPKTHDEIEISLGCEDVASKTASWNARNDEDAIGSQGSSDRTSELKVVDQILEPLTAVVVKDTSDPSREGSLMDLESGQESPKGQTLNTVHTHSGARIAATALFTANPHYNSHELSTACNPNSNFTCQSEGFELLTFPGSNVSDNASRKERKVRSEQVVCSSFESHICSSPELNGYTTVDKRNQSSTPIETDSLDVGGRTFDESSHPLPAPLDKRLQSSLHLVAPSCTSDVNHEWEDVQAEIGLNGPDFCMAPMHACQFLAGQNETVWEDWNKNRLAPQTSNCLDDLRILTASAGDPSRKAVDLVQAVNVQNHIWNQNSLTEQGKQKDDVLLTDDSAGGQTLPTTCRSGLAETSFFPTCNSLENDSHSVFPTESEPNGRALKTQGSGLGLVTLFGMKNFAKLGVGSTRDSAMTAQMAMRITDALERLGDIGNPENVQKKSFASIDKGIWTDGHSHSIYGRQENPLHDPEAKSDCVVVGSDLKRFRNGDDLLCENRRLESHFFRAREHGEEMLGRVQISKQAKVIEAPSLHSIHEAKSATPEEPDLYLQSVIAALDFTDEADVKESTLQTSASTTRLQGDHQCRTVGEEDAGVSTNLSKAHADERTLTTPGEVFKGHVDRHSVADNRILHSTNVVKADTVLEEKPSASDVNSTGELIPHHYDTHEEPAQDGSTEHQPAFSIQINAPPGSFFQVEVGGHSTVCDQLEEANDQGLGNSLTHPSATLGHQGKFNVRVAHSKSGLSQQKSLQTASLTHQERPAPSPYGTSPLSALNVVEERKQTKQACLGTLEVSPPMAPQIDSLSPKSPRTPRFSTQEDLRHSFDRKITSLVKKANQLQEEAMLSGTSPKKLQGSRFRQRQVEVTEPKRQPDFVPSAKVSRTFVNRDDCDEGQCLVECIEKRRDAEKKDAALVNGSKVRKAQGKILKASVKAKSLDSYPSSCTNHGASHAARTAMKAFGAAAAGVARELNVLMKDRIPGQILECRAPNKRKVAWASPEAYVLGPRSTTSESGMQPVPLKHTQATQQPATNSKSTWLDDGAPSAGQVVCEVRKTKEQQKGPFLKQPKAPKHRQSLRKVSVHEDYEICTAGSASPIAETEKKQVRQETGFKSEQPLLVRERGRTQVPKALEASTGETFDYDQFRQELKDLQLERTKLERLVHTIFTSDADPIEQKCSPSPFSAQEGKTGNVPAGHLQQNPECKVKSTRRDSSLDEGDERKKSTISRNRDSCKKVTGPDSGLPVSSDRGDRCLGTNHLLKSLQLPTNEGLKRDLDIFDNHSLDHMSSQNDCTIRKPTHKKFIKFKNVQQQQTGVSLLTLKETSEMLQGKTRSHKAANATIGHRNFEPPVALVGKSFNVLSDDTVGSKATIKSHPQVDRTTNQSVGSNAEEEDIEQSPCAFIPSEEACNIDRQHVQDVPDKSEGYTKFSVASSGVQLQGKGAQVGFIGEPESRIRVSANLGFSSTDVLQEKFPSLHSILTVEDDTPAMQSGYGTSNLQVAKPDYFKEYLLQALDSSILLLEHCVSRSEGLQDPALLNIHPMTGLATKMPEEFLDSDSNTLNCDDRLSDGITQGNVSNSIILKLPDRHSALDSNVQVLQEDEPHLKDGDAANNQKLEPRLHPSQSMVSLEQTLESGTPKVEKAISEIQNMPFDQPRESDSKVSSSEKETSWSGSLKSVMEAYKEAERSAALLMSSALEVPKSRGRPTFSCRSEHSDKLPDIDKKKLQIQGTLKRKEKPSPLTLLEKAERAEAKELKLRLAHNKYIKSKQNLLSSRGLIGGKDKLQGHLRKHYSGREQWKVPKLIYRTAEFGQKRREDWNDSTEISHDRYSAGWNPKAKEAAQTLITEVLNKELMRNQRRQEVKNLRPVKPLKANMSRKRKDSVNLETYANTIVLMTEREKPLLTKGSPPREDKRESDKVQGIQDDVHTEEPTPTFSLDRKAEDYVDYFSVNRNLLDTENHVVDESTLVFRKTRGRNSGAGADLMNQNVRESIEHWLDTSGGFEYLDTYNSAGEEKIFERQESTNSTQRNATISTMTGEPEKNFSDETWLDKLTFPCSAMEERGLSSTRTTVLEGTGKGLQGDLLGASSVANRDAIQFSMGKNEEFPLRIGSGNDNDHARGLSAYSSLNMDKSLLGGSFGLSKGSDQMAREFPPQEPGDVDVIGSEAHVLYGKDSITFDGNTCPSQRDRIPYCFSTGVTADQQTEELLPRQDAHAGSPKFNVNQTYTYPRVQPRDCDEKLTEEEELELALLEIVLHTILKDDPPSETAATLISEVPLVPEKGHAIGSSGTPTVPCQSMPCSVPGRMTSMLTDDKRLHDGTYLDQGVQTLEPDLPSPEISSQEQGIDSAKSSGEDWPEYKCLAEMESGSQSVEEDEHWPEYNGVDEREDGVDLNQGAQIEELPENQISTSSTSEVDTDEKLPGGIVPPQVVAVSTRPPYSAVHSMRAAERQSIDFPGIASLAFGYPSPRPPPSKPIGQTSVDRNSVSVQTADMSITQAASLSTSVFVIPFYCLPPYSMYLSPSAATAASSQVTTVPMAVPAQHGSQFIAAAPTGVVPIFPPSYVFPPPAPFSQGVSQTSVMPVAPIVQNSQQTPAPSSTAEYAQTNVQNQAFPPSSSHPSATEGPSQPSPAVKLASTSAKDTSSRSRKFYGAVTEQAKLSNLLKNQRDSLSSSDSCRSSLATPSTILSSPEHESRVASALAHPRRISRGTAGHVFEECSSDEPEAYGEEVRQCKQDEDVQSVDKGTLLPPCLIPLKEEADPLLQSIIAEYSYKQSRIEIALGLPSLSTHMATPNEFFLDERDGEGESSGISRSVDSARSSVLIASFDVSSLSEGSVKHTRGKARRKSSGQSSLDGVCQFRHSSRKRAVQVGFSQTSSRSSGEILGSNGISLDGLDENQRRARRHFTSRTLRLSEGEVEPGQLPSEGEYFGGYVMGTHPRLLLSRHTDGHDNISEPGEICKQAFMPLRPPRSELRGGDSSRSQSLSEGELRLETLTEPGEVRADRLLESQEAKTSSDLAK